MAQTSWLVQDTANMCRNICFAKPTCSISPDLQAVKVCGLVSPSDALMVAKSFRSIIPSNVHLLLGMILWPGSRRSVPASVAREIARVAQMQDATAVGVFVDEDVETMEKFCNECGINVVQLHGQACRSAWASATNRSNLRWIDVRDVAPDGTVSPKTTSLVGTPLWSLFDTKGGGTGKPFSWDQFSQPTEPWLLAGGLDPQNVAEAVDKLHPHGVDVATGVAGPDKCSKDERRVHLFFETLADAYC